MSWPFTCERSRSELLDMKTAPWRKVTPSGSLRYGRWPDGSVARLLSGSAAEPFGRLAGGLPDAVEALVLMQDDEASALGDGSTARSSEAGAAHSPGIDATGGSRNPARRS